MKKYLLDKKEEIKELEVRKRLLNLPETRNFVISIIGPRRAGKTYSLFSLIKNKKIKNEDFIFANFEDEDIAALERKEITKMVSYHREIYGKEPVFVFLDEVQAFENWERFVYTLFEKKKYFIYITGSNSRFLSREIATQLRGRALSVLVLPMSFKEFLSLRSIDAPDIERLSTRKEDEIKNMLRNYLKEGGFPDIVMTPINRRVFFRDYIDLIVYRDVVERYRIREPHLIKMLIGSMLPSFSKEFSVNRIFNMLKSKGIRLSKKVLYSYLHALEDSMFCFLLRKFSFSERESVLSIPKVYMNDTGLINYTVSTKFGEDIGKIMENAVFIELKRRESEGKLDALFYWRDYQGREVDFVVKEGLNVKQLIQVTYASGRDEIEKREIKSLLKASEVLKCRNLLCITWDFEGEETLNGKRIRFVPLWKWLLEL